MNQREQRSSVIYCGAFTGPRWTMAAAANNALVTDRRCSGALTTTNRIGSSRRAQPTASRVNSARFAMPRRPRDREL